MHLSQQLRLQGSHSRPFLTKASCRRPFKPACSTIRNAECRADLRRKVATIGLAVVLGCGNLVSNVPATRADELTGTIAELVREYKYYDINNDGIVDVDELRKAIYETSGVAIPKGVLAREVIPSIDFNSDGKVQTTEFLRALSLEAPLDGRMWAIFDRNVDNGVDVREFAMGLGDLGGQAGLIVQQIAFSQNDYNRDGRLDPEELAYALDWVATGVLGDLNDDGQLDTEPSQ